MIQKNHWTGRKEISDRLEQHKQLVAGLGAGSRYAKDRGNRMAITVNIYYTGENGNARKFAEEMTLSGVVKDIREESGNIRYEYFFPMEDKETVLLIDSWLDQKSLDAHHASPMMAEIIRLREKYDLHMRVERYVTDGAGIPAGDERFIKA